MSEDTVDVQDLAKRLNELLVLAVLRDGPKHGYQIALEVEGRSGGLFAFRHGTLYPILHRLEAGGWIEGAWAAEDGRRRKDYALTPAGRRRVAAEARRFAEVFRGVLGLLREGE